MFPVSELPPELKHFEATLDTLPVPDNAVFLYQLCMMLYHAGKMKIADVVEGEDGEMMYFETTSGVKFNTFRPSLDRQTLLEIMKRLLPMLKAAEMEITGNRAE